MGNMMWRARLSKHPNDDPEKSADLWHRLIVPRNMRNASGYSDRILLRASSAASRKVQPSSLSAATEVGKARLAASSTSSAEIWEAMASCSSWAKNG